MRVAISVLHKLWNVGKKRLGKTFTLFSLPHYPCLYQSIWSARHSLVKLKSGETVKRNKHSICSFLRSYKFGPVLLIKTILKILNLFLSFIATLTDAKDWDGLKPILYLLSFYKAKDLPSRHHLNSKTNGPVLLIKIVFRLWPVANDGKPVEID